MPKPVYGEGVVDGGGAAAGAERGRDRPLPLVPAVGLQAQERHPPAHRAKRKADDEGGVPELDLKT